MPQIKLQDINIEYQEFIPEINNYETIIFMHGRGGNLLSWFQQIPYFSKKYRCVVYSQRGFGHSYDLPDGPGWSSFPNDLKGVMDNLNIKQAHLVAQSMGGVSALGFAVNNPERVLSITFADTTGGMGEPELEREMIKWKENNPRTRGRFEAISEIFEKQNPEMANLYFQIGLSNPELTNPDMSLSKINLLGGPSGDQLKALTMPVLFIVGEYDTLMPPKIIKLASKFIRHSKYIYVPGCGHSVYFEKPDIFNFEVLKFIQS
ncbi:MAG: hypothetical protein CL796_00255 [Chloroflexi bacterium]|nr:hypothetical protein [Chloroflexota bacterium]|tara:strand:+ start:10259 stop:11044 length:786 start_codon:yes stop_codon:yes gene_type:complete